jgi:hypothetical protein
LGTRLSLHPLFIEGRRLANLGRYRRRENAESHLEFHVIASEAKQSILSSRGEMDCFAEPVISARALLRSSGARIRATRWLAMTVWLFES